MEGAGGIGSAGDAGSVGGAEASAGVDSGLSDSFDSALSSAANDAGLGEPDPGLAEDTGLAPETPDAGLEAAGYGPAASFSPDAAPDLSSVNVVETTPATPPDLDGLLSPAPIADVAPAALTGGIPQTPDDLATLTSAVPTVESPAFDPAAVLDPLAYMTQPAAEAAVGYRNAMYGERPFGIPDGGQQLFGQITHDSTLADRSFTSRTFGNGIDAFARPGSLAQQTMVSSQATYDYARQQAALRDIPADQVTFELKDELSPNRRYDVRLGPEFDDLDARTPMTEIKAGKSINSGQLALDRAAAQAGLPVDYQFAGNPLTGSHGPTPDAARQLDNAAAATNGMITHGIADVAPGKAAIESLEAAATISRAARGIGRVAAPIGVAADAYAIGSGIAADGGTFGRNATIATAGAAGGWAGAAAGGWGGVQAGAAIGAFGGPVGAAVGAVAGGLIGAIGGGLLGGWGAESAARAATD